jgi:DNA-binding FadR family transcriptional regulator
MMHVRLADERKKIEEAVRQQEQQKAQEAIKELEQKYREALNSAAKKPKDA